MPITDFKSLVNFLVNFIELLIVLVFALTFLAFMWGIVSGWIFGAGDEEGIKKGKDVATAGVIALVIMVSVWGIVYLFKTSLFGII
jgi:hypothetical protein